VIKDKILDIESSLDWARTAAEVARSIAKKTQADGWTTDEWLGTREGERWWRLIRAYETRLERAKARQVAEKQAGT